MRVGLVHAATNVRRAVALRRRARAAGPRRARPAAVAGRRRGRRAPARCSAATWATGRRPGPTTARRSRTSARRTGSRSARWRRYPSASRLSGVAGDVPVFVLRRGRRRRADGISVLSDRCPHLSAPLHEGDIVDVDGEAHIVCPWHGSEFRVADGCVVHGPATAPVPRFESRVVGDELQARVVTIPGRAGELTPPSLVRSGALDGRPAGPARRRCSRSPDEATSSSNRSAQSGAVATQRGAGAQHREVEHDVRGARRRAPSRCRSCSSAVRRPSGRAWSARAPPSSRRRRPPPPRRPPVARSPRRSCPVRGSPARPGRIGTAQPAGGRSRPIPRSTVTTRSAGWRTRCPPPTPTGRPPAPRW